ncbi:MAG: filamentous hemagglutinin N-terminal domain-containing protein [Nitrospira sp.]|nr:filamentous hemagglutinin N-terminal domain-containing protein [Nitrospira sp.]MBH0187025.1 filamentous hemagglutinin N-terminal domain-containing protein [Nitrospira sp.]
MRQAFLWTLLPIVALILIAPSVTTAQEIPTDITSSGLNTQIDQVGNSYNITGGTRPGGGPNLFHSFGQFDVGQIAGINDIANFLNDSGIDTTNILARVTGPNISQIYGTIQTTGFGTANLFLINPSGIVLGPGASLNVAGSVSFTTAQYIRLFDGLASSANFYANPASDGSILTIDPSAFEFSSATPAAYGFSTAPDPNATITVQGSNLSVSSGQSISLVGGEVVIESGAQLTAPSGTILLATAASPGEFDVNTLQSIPNTDGTSFASFGTVIMTPGSSIDVHDTNTVWIKGGQLVLSMNDATLNTSESPAPSDMISLGAGSFISTSNSGSDPGANVQITAGSLQVDGAAVTTINSGDGNGGNIFIDATTVGLTNGAAILSSTGLDFATFANAGFGDGGHITTNVGTLSLTNGATITSLNSSLGLGQGGNVTIQGQQGAGSAADSVMLGNATGTGSTISTFTASDSGRGGNVSITATQLLIENASVVSSDTVLGSGVGGDLSLNVGTLTLKGGDFGGSSIRSTNSASGTDLDFDGVPDVFNAAGGKVNIQGVNGAGSAADTVTLSGGSQIRTETLISGDGGGVSLATTSLKMGEASTITSETFQIGLGGDIVVSFQNASLSGEATIASRTAFADPTAAAGGTIMLQGLDGPGTKAGTFTLTGFRTGIISESFGSGDPGNVEVHAETVSLMGGAVIEAGNPQNTGAGGDVIITAGSVKIVGNAGVPGTESHISSQASGLDAGQVTITADQLILDNGSIASSTVLNSPGRGGDVVLNVGIVSLTNGATINGSTAGTGHAGNITITAQSVTMSAGSSIAASSTGTGNAGNITIDSGSTVLMENSSITTEASQASGGQITINAPNMIRLIDSTVSTSVAGAANDSNGGNISIDPDFVILKGSQILAQAFAGEGGDITIVAGLFLADPSSIVDASSDKGISGTVQINTPINNLSSVVGRLPESLVEVQALLRAACAARMAQRQASSFVERGRDSIPAGPEGLLTSPYLPMTSGHLSQRPATPSRELSTIQVRRLSGNESPAPAIILSEHTTCSS